MNQVLLLTLMYPFGPDHVKASSFSQFCVKGSESAHCQHKLYRNDSRMFKTFSESMSISAKWWWKLLRAIRTWSSPRRRYRPGFCDMVG
jgi:hypothetical protein